MKNLNRHGSRLIKLILAFIATTILLLWGWNSAIPDLFGLPTIEFKQAPGLMVLIVIVFVLLRSGHCHDREVSTLKYSKAPDMGKPS
jgi:hypothetical protein